MKSFGVSEGIWTHKRIKPKNKDRSSRIRGVQWKRKKEPKKPAPTLEEGERLSKTILRICALCEIDHGNDWRTNEKRVHDAHEALFELWQMAHLLNMDYLLKSWFSNFTQRCIILDSFTPETNWVFWWSFFQVSFFLDTQRPFLYIQPTPKRVLVNNIE